MTGKHYRVIASDQKVVLWPCPDVCKHVVGIALLCLAVVLVGAAGSFVARNPLPGILAVCGALLTGVAALLLRSQAHRLGPNEATLIALIGCGLAFSMFFPIGSIPDEPYHFIRSYAYSNMLMGYESDAIRHEDLYFYYQEVEADADGQGVKAREVSVDRWSGTAEFDGPLADGGTSGITHTRYLRGVLASGANPIQSKIGAAIGVSLARALGLSATGLFYSGRLFNMLFCAILIYAALRITPVGSNIFAIIALMPMSVQQMMSYSYDGPIVAFSFVLLALILRAIMGEGHISLGLSAAIIAMAIILGPCKVVYSLIAFLTVLIPSRRFNSQAEKWVFVAAAFVLPLVYTVIIRMRSISTAAAGTSITRMEEDGEIVTGGPVTLADILADPLGTAYIFLNTIAHRGVSYAGGVVGSRLGLREDLIATPQAVTALLLLVLLVAAIGDERDHGTLGVGGRLLFLLIALMIIGAIMLSLMLTWTLKGETIIEGVQGRYFTPVMPCILLALRGRKVRINGTLLNMLVPLMSAANLSLLSYLSVQVLLTA